tara:strand:- start:28 stop:579 length:552 start_codon:yes stop_codon:yes gene_type:complete
MVITRSGKDTSKRIIWGHEITSIDKDGYFDIRVKNSFGEIYTAKIPLYFHYIDKDDKRMLKNLTQKYDIDIQAYTDQEDMVSTEWCDWDMGCTPLSYAARNGDWEMVKYLLKLDAHINSGEDLDGDNALHHAVKQDDVIMVRYLLDMGADMATYDCSQFQCDDGEIKDMLMSVLLVDEEAFKY